eukprot:COSAG01_NODE_9987_length_2281_cov_88.571036_2_plen_86_part_00
MPCVRCMHLTLLWRWARRPIDWVGGAAAWSHRYKQMLSTAQRKLELSKEALSKLEKEKATLTSAAKAAARAAKEQDVRPAIRPAQ